MRDEILDCEKGYSRLVLFSPIITKLYPGLFRSTNFRKWPDQVLVQARIHKPASELVQQTYLEISSRLKSVKAREAGLNHAENYLENEIRARSSLQFHRNIWIGGRNVDFFFDSIGNVSAVGAYQSMKGFAIEVDGEIHNTGSKTSKDQSKYRFLHDLGIGLQTIESNDAKSAPTIQKQILPILLNKNFRLSTRDVARVRLRRYLSTIIANSNLHDLCRLFRIDSELLMKATSQAKSICNSSPDMGVTFEKTVE